MCVTPCSTQAGATPQGLIDAGIYAQIAVPLKGGEYRRVSMALFAQALADGVPADCVPVAVEEPWPRAPPPRPHARPQSAAVASSRQAGPAASMKLREEED